METTDWQNLSKKERRQLKKEQKRLKRQQEEKSKLLVKWGSILGTLVFLVGGFFFFRGIEAKRHQEAPKIQITPFNYNFGEISAAEGRVETRFQVKNVGVSPLVISGMETSCGCTSARLEKNGEKSPVFGMHNNPSDWSTNLEPEEEAELVVILDPNFHENAFGPINRRVSIFSNDPGKIKEVEILANVQR